MPFPATLEEICSVAQRAVSIFSAANLQCCLFGSAACAQYGASRCPNDVDLYILTPGLNSEDVKQMLAQWDKGFFLVHARGAAADYNVLWYRLTSRGGTVRSCKVDILVPGATDIPLVPPGRIETVGALPLMPLILLLLLKLQGWVGHRDSDRLVDWAKEHVDVADIAEIVAIACRRRDKVGQNSLDWLPARFVRLARDHVRQYVAERAETARYWQVLGFDT
ncbi:hypothetical protein B0H21DRAFT_689746 [Amylocystis lapponica]|nr:hypothetical protein B0H21DRAFT_689746 [Amylocystis lapponica]